MGEGILAYRAEFQIPDDVTIDSDEHCRRLRDAQLARQHYRDRGVLCRRYWHQLLYGCQRNRVYRSQLADFQCSTIMEFPEHYAEGAVRQRLPGP